MFSTSAVLKKSNVALVIALLYIFGSATMTTIHADPVVTEYAIPTAKSRPFGITTGSDGALWFAEGDGNNIGRITTDGKITEYAIPTPQSNPGTLTSGPDKAVWFLERFGNKVGHITMDGQITEFVIPTTGSDPTIKTASGATVSSSLPQGIVTGP